MLLFSCFALPDSFSAVPWASAPVVGGTDVVGSRFDVLRPRTRFRRFRGRRVPYSCFTRSYSFSAVPTASGPVFKSCAPGLILGGAEGVGSRYHILRSRTCIRQFRGRRVPFSCFASPYSFFAIPRASGPIFMFCAPILVFGGSKGVRSRFHVWRSGTHFRRYRVRRVPFSCFALPKTPELVFDGGRVSGPVFMICAPGLIFGGSEGVVSSFHVLRPRTHFWRYRGRRGPF
jgi:hypothetical protein